MGREGSDSFFFFYLLLKASIFVFFRSGVHLFLLDLIGNLNSIVNLEPENAVLMACWFVWCM